MASDLTLPPPELDDVEQIIPTDDPAFVSDILASQGGLEYLDTRGRRGVAFPENPAEMTLFSQLTQYDEETRGRMLDIKQNIRQARDVLAKRDKYPTDLDNEILQLIDAL
jgi:hypothetical protein